VPGARGFVPRVLLYHASRDLVPLYAVYSLLFADHGISASHISVLLIIWSATSFVLEVPSGAWADAFDRRHLLVASAFVYAAGFTTWMAWPTFPGFALGFVLWGVSSSLMSGTFESLVYDELVERGASDAYPSLVGWAYSTALVANLAATLLAAPLLALGGYPFVGWASVAICGVQAALAATLPVSEQARRPTRDSPIAETERAASRYVAMLRAGLAESRHHPDVRRILLLTAAMVGLTAYDEYFPLVARAHGVTTADIPLLLAITVGGQAIGTALVGRTARLTAPAVGGLLAVGALLVSLGALVTPYVGFVAIGVGYGALNNAMLVGETRLQDAITGPARATVTSVLGFLEEVVALSVYAAFALGSHVLGFPALVALLAVPVLVVAAAVARHLPPAGRVREDSSVGVPPS
jgi:MFS family permease